MEAYEYNTRDVTIQAMDNNKKPLDSLRPAVYNPRTMDETMGLSLDDSMFGFGDLSAIVNNVATDTLVGGHQRIKRLLKRPEAHIVYTEKFEQPDSLGTVALGYVIVDGTDLRLPYREVSWTPEVEMAANVAANYIQGQFVMPMLAKIDEQLKATNEQLLRMTGQPQEMISQLLDQFGSKQESTEQGDVAAASTIEQPKSLHGVVYQLGRHRLMCGDSKDPPSVDFLMNGQRAAMTFTDPPYNVAYAGAGNHPREGIKNDKMSSSEFAGLLGSWCHNILRVTDGAIYICMSPKELGTLKIAFESNGGHWHDYIIWVKNHLVLGGGDFQHQYEPILYGWPERLTGKYVSPDRDKTDVWEDISSIKSDFDGTHTRIRLQGFEIVIEGKVQGKVKRKKSQSDIWRFNKPAASPEHPTMKPTELCAEAIKNSSKHGEIVLDLFGGSGSTLIAAEDTDRVCYMMELDERYADVIRMRYAKLMGHGDDWETFCPAVQRLSIDQGAAAQ